MNNLAQRIDDYILLSPEERAQVVRAVRERPELAERLREAQAFTAVLESAASSSTDEVSDQRLAEYVVDDAFGFADPDAEIAARATSDSVLQARIEKMKARMEVLRGARRPETERDEAARGARLSAQGRASSPLRLLSGHTARNCAAVSAGKRRSNPLTARWGRLAVAATMLMAVTYTALFAVGEMTRPDRARVANLEDIVASYQPVTVRGVSDPPPIEAQYETAVEALEDARESTFGLFAHYDATALEAAAAQFRTVAEGADPQSGYAQEAMLALARISVYRDRPDEARRWLSRLVEGNSYRAGEARRLLNALSEGVLSQNSLT